MEFKNISIEGVGGIRKVELEFNPNVNIICGPNSIGKTTILESIGHTTCWGGTQLLKKNALSEEGRINTTLSTDNCLQTITYSIKHFPPQQKDHLAHNQNLGPYILSLKAQRTFGYTELEKLSHDKVQDSWDKAAETERGVQINDLKNWFVNRYLFADKKDALRDSQKANFELAKECFSIINPNFKFKTVLAESFDIILETPQGDIYYEYLSSGYKSILYILFGIIKEIEMRFRDPSVKAADFDGVILIDEIELHLHPEWQTRIVSVLTKTFPKAQFFLTTHSPHVIQTAAPTQVIPLEEVEPGVLRRKEIPVTEYGFQGWTVEEILKDVMGMEVLRPNRYRDLMNRFYKAVQANNRQEAEKTYSLLCAILHPENVTRKILDLQLAGVVDDADVEQEIEAGAWDESLPVVQ